VKVRAININKGGGNMPHLTKSNIKNNMIIICKDHEDWGTFRVLNKYDDGIWEIRGEVGDRTLFESEFKFWIMKEN
jgi:hypothetical protein